MKTLKLSGLLIAGVLLAGGTASAQQGKLFTGSDPGNADSGGIKVLDVIYGQDDRICRALRDAQRACDSRATCEIRATDDLCGNPYDNVAKNLFVAFECDGEDGRRTVTVDEGEVASLYCRNSAGTTQSSAGTSNNDSAPPANWRRDRIYIADVQYGFASRRCDATREFARQCDGERDCSVTVDNGLCGDPADGFRKEADITMWCNGNSVSAVVAEDDTARLRCP